MRVIFGGGWEKGKWGGGGRGSEQDEIVRAQIPGLVSGFLPGLTSYIGAGYIWWWLGEEEVWEWGGGRREGVGAG